MLDRARSLGGPAIERASTTLAETLAALEAAGIADRVQVDFGLLRDLGYYTGAILEVYDPAVGEAIGGGGRYDDLLGRFGSPQPAAGFALYLERLHVAQAAEQDLRGRPMTAPSVRSRGNDGALTLALPRGSLFEGCLAMLDGAGFDTSEPRGDSRALIFELDGADDRHRPALRRPDLRRVGSGRPRGHRQGRPRRAERPRRLRARRPRLRRAAGWRSPRAPATSDLERAERRLGLMRIATKYPRTASAWFERMGRQAEVIEVKGSVELAPLVGLADGIVDLVDTGRTLAENGLEVVEEISVCTARLIANRVAHKLRVDEVDAMVERLREAAAG